MPANPIVDPALCSAPTAHVGSIGRPSELSTADREQMHGLLSEHFLDVERTQFDRDLSEKEWVVLVRDETTRAIRGFSTLMRLKTTVDGQLVLAVYSGDTIVDESARSQVELHRVWCRHVLQLAQQSADTPLYWFLVSCGYKTYRFLPLFFQEFYPNYQRAIPDRMKQRLDALARMKFGDQYDADSGIVRFNDPTPLRSGVADVTSERLRDANVAFYVQANPGHVEGHGLACLTEFSLANFTAATHRLLRS